ncbi:LamG-like jellyroll fold domain-containing protein [uncultured Sneathiella sp.]|jgi:outer membrane biosynthesis protein TonB|uniref:LamG-like jellyroll fold domain-containing protein n=1 Tax=uncultured Sneathiella sp. TaxID=879315 RepID=UPI002594D677|nr:LamG-like jellyroll fold domain-containing protein [uncultured Sneathiella sp.]
MANTTITVSSSAELSAALNNATGGETIVLNSGYYGDLNIYNANFNSEVTIVSANPDNMAVFETVTLNNSSNITFDTIEVDFNPTVNTYSHESSVLISNSSDITVRNSHIEGDVATQNGVGSVAGYPVARGITAEYSQNITFENNDISYFQKGIILIEAVNIDILNNSIENLRLSHIAGADVHDVNIDGNYLGAVTPYNYGGAGDHGDYIHFWINTGQSQNSSDIVITDNFFAEAEGDRMMGIYLEDHWGESASFEDVVIDNNVFHLADHQTILVEGAQGIDITNNTLLQSSGAPNDAPGVVLSLGVKDAVINNNIFSAPIAELTNDIQIVSESNNIIVQNTNPNGANYVGNLFENALAYNPSLLDLLQSGNLNTGANLTEAGTGSSNGNNNPPEEPTNETPEEPTNETPEEPTNETPEEPTNETPEEPSNPNQPTDDNTEPTTPVETTVLIKAAMNGSAANSADANSDDDTVSNSVSFEQVGNRAAAKLNDGVIIYDADDKFINNDAYTLTFDFKKEAGAEDASGYAIYYSSSFVVKINADSIMAAIVTSKGTNWVTMDDVDINNTDWHQMTLTFSGETGEAVFYVDGDEVATVSGLEGATQTGSAWHDFYVGGEFGDSFDGLIDNVMFAQGAITADQAAESYEAMVSGTESPNDDPVDETPEEPTDPVDETPEEPEVPTDPVDETPEEPTNGDGGNNDNPSLDEELEIAALNVAAANIGDGIINLGMEDDYFGMDDFTASVTFALDSLDDGRQRLLWNHTNYGVQIEDDDLVVYFAEEGGQLKVYTFENAITDTDWHDVQLVLDDDADTFSVYLDGQALRVDDAVTGGIADASWWNVTVGGTEFQNTDEFHGKIADYSIIDEALYIDGSQSVYERTAYIDSFDEHNSSNLDVIGVALTEDSLDFA